MDGDRYLINITTYRNRNRSDVVEKVLAFDGDEFQRLDVTQSILSTNKSSVKRQVKNPYESRQLITMPFAFLLDRLDYQDYQALKDRGNWASLIAAGRIAGEERVRGLDCWVVSIGDRGDAKEVRLALAKALDNYPIQSEVTGKGYRWIDRVEEHRVVEGARGPIVIPLKVSTETEMTSDSGWSKGRTVATLDPSSLKVNEPIDPGEFTLSKTQVDLYQDLAKQEGYRRGQRLREPAEIARKVEGGWRGATSLIFALSAALLIVGGLTLIVRRLRGSRTSS
ncbi:MAG TPA: hypothetical protein VG406_05515 [Isosphaeraceae bacterium]|nr:hypothetical protein [Isosphaeraceae bacterium]